MTIPRITGRPWSSQDSVGLTLPSCLREPFLSAVNDLPDKLSAITTSVAGERHVEIYSITPADPFVEAARRALQDHIALHFIDRDFKPGELAGRSCSQPESWPEDDMALYLGAESWLETIEAYYSFPPARVEPLDSFRESFIGLQLAQLLTMSSRILLVCQAGNVRPLLQLLSRPVTHTAFSPVSDLTLAYKKRRLSRSGLLRTMDDYPAIVERFEECRDDSKTFDRLQAFREVVLNTIAESDDLKVSPRRQIAFEILLSNALSLTRRCFPQPALVFEAARGCFGVPFANRLVSRLYQYGEQLPPEAVPIKQLVGKREDEPMLAPVAGPFVQRSCRPFQVALRPEPRNPPLTREEEGETVVRTWPSLLEAKDRMCARALRAVNWSSREPRIESFSGSLGLGIDIRRTMRGLLELGNDLKRNRQMRPRKSIIYVRTERRVVMQQNLDDEPVVWFRHFGRDWDIGFQVSTFSESETVQSLGAMSGLKKIWESEDESERCARAESLGGVEYSPSNKELEDWKKKLGDNIQKRFPMHDRMTHPRRGRRLLGCMEEDLVDAFEQQFEWWEILLLMGFRYCTKSILVVAPTGYRIPWQVSAHASAHGKSAVVVDWNKMAGPDIGLLEYKYLFQFPKSKQEVKVTERYASVMRSYIPF
jgi:hypothetical protein